MTDKRLILLEKNDCFFFSYAAELEQFKKFHGRKTVVVTQRKKATFR